MGKERRAEEAPAPDAWIAVGTRAFRVFFGDLSREHQLQPQHRERIERELERRLHDLVEPFSRKYGRGDHATVEDLVQDVKLRVARIDASAKYDPTRCKPATYLRGIARTVAWERLGRRQPPRMERLDFLDEPVVPADRGLLGSRPDVSSD